MTAKRQSLASFAANSKPAQQAWLPSLPECGEVVEAYKSGIAPSVIRRWLAEECGYGEQATKHRVVDWLRDHAR